MTRRPSAPTLATPALLASVLVACAPVVDGTGAPGAPPVLRAGDTAGASDTSLVRLGDYVRARGDLETAVTLYRRAVAAEPESAEALTKLGQALAETGAYEQAAGSYNAALARDPDDAAALRGLGVSQVALGRGDQAVATLNRVLREDPDDAAAYGALGVAYDLLGRNADARRTYQAGLERDPTDLDLRSNLALSEALGGDAGRAASALREVASEPGAERRHVRNLVLVLALAGRREEAERVALLRLGPDEAASLLAQAASVGAAGDPASRAFAVGMASRRG